MNRENDKDLYEHSGHWRAMNRDKSSKEDDFSKLLAEVNALGYRLNKTEKKIKKLMKMHKRQKHEPINTYETIDGNVRKTKTVIDITTNFTNYTLVGSLKNMKVPLTDLFIIPVNDDATISNVIFKPVNDDVYGPFTSVRLVLYNNKGFADFLTKSKMHVRILEKLDPASRKFGDPFTRNTFPVDVIFNTDSLSYEDVVKDIRNGVCNKYEEILLNGIALGNNLSCIAIDTDDLFEIQMIKQ